jgi:DNA anti-recombination protein RmuC
MNDSLEKKLADEITLKMKIEDILEVVSKSSKSSMISDSQTHFAEGEDLKKAWFRHMLFSMEKLNDLVETVRSVDITNLKTDLKEEIRKVELRIEKLEQQIKENRTELFSKIDKVDTELTTKLDKSHQELLKKIEEVHRDLQAYKITVENKFNTAEKELKEYKKEVVDPLKTRLLTVSVKLGVWATVAGLVGSGLFAFGFYLVRIFVFKTP